MESLKIVIRVLLRRWESSITTVIIVFIGLWTIRLPVVGGENVDQDVNLKGGIVALIIAGIFFWRMIGKEISQGIKKGK